MKKSIKEALEDASTVMEEILGKLPNMTLQEKVDVAARLKAVSKNAEKVDELVKKDIKSKLRDKAGTVLGETFKAVLALVPTSKFDQKAFKEAEPDTYDSYVKEDDQPRITFEPR